MFILNNIKAKTSEPHLFTAQKRKYLKFQLKDSVKKHPFPAKIINPYEIVWEGELNFNDIYYNQNVPLQLFEWHNFGYDVKELNGILQGKMKIDKDMQTFSSQLRTPGSNKILGFLSAKISHKGETIQKRIQKKAASPQHYQVKSIVAHIPLAVNKKIYMTIDIASHSLKTQPIKTFCGDLVFTDLLQCDKLDTETKGKLGIWQIVEGEDVKLGEGVMDVTGIKPNKRVTLVGNDKERMGQAYVDSLQEYKQDMKKKSSSLPNYLHKISPKKVMERTLSSRISSINIKKVSVVTNNQSIMFGTERRFKEGGTQKKLRETGNPQIFNQTRSSRRTKISQLRANKIFNKPQLSTIFQQQTPGVGQYVLPSIWDKY